MDWLKKLLLKGIKEKAQDEARKFTWSQRERELLLAEGFDPSQITLSEKINRVAGASWVDRQVKL